jgi:hypothetical protein
MPDEPPPNPAHPEARLPDGQVSKDPWRETAATLLLYAAALLAYALLGMYWHFLLSWTRGFIFVLAAVWLLPMLYRRLRP